MPRRISAMHVQLELDRPPTVFTNLDFIRGKVVLRLTTVTPITSVVVKLEGESQTRLINPGRPELNERPKPVDELHKVRILRRLTGRNAV